MAGATVGIRCGWACREATRSPDSIRRPRPRPRRAKDVQTLRTRAEAARQARRQRPTTPERTESTRAGPLRRSDGWWLALTRGEAAQKQKPGIPYISRLPDAPLTAGCPGWRAARLLRRRREWSGADGSPLARMWASASNTSCGARGMRTTTAAHNDPAADVSHLHPRRGVAPLLR